MNYLKINFSDFWPGFIKDNNFFFNLLSKKYSLVIDENPDILFFSSYGNSYLKYKCPRIFYSAENERADFTCCDLAMTFDFSKSNKHFRLPLYVLHIDRSNNLKELTAELARNKMIETWNTKKKFCCIVVSNGNAKKRLFFFKDISNLRSVDSGGRFMNNIGGAVLDKIEFIKDYKFVISFENSSFPGYTTEKILEPFVVNSIPIYWGNRLVNYDFNPFAFINASDFKNNYEIIELMSKIENNIDLALSYLCPPKIQNVSEKDFFNKDKIMAFIEKAIYLKSPVAQSVFYSHLHWVKNKFKILRFYFLKYTVGNFR